MTTKIEMMDENTSNDGEKWFEVSGTDYGTGWGFDGVEVFAVCEDGGILNCDGCPLTKGDLQTVAVQNALEAA